MTINATPKSRVEALGKVEFFGPGFHTTFRQGIDSPFAVLVHRIIDALPDRVYRDFCSYVCAAIQDAEAFDAGILRKAAMGWMPNIEFGDNVGHLQAGQTFRAVLGALPTDAWADAAAFLTYDPDNYSAPRPTEPESGIEVDWLSLNEDQSRLSLSIDVTSSSVNNHRVATIRVIEELLPRDGSGRQRRVIVGYAPRVFGHPPIDLPTPNGFPTVEEALEACRASFKAGEAARKRLRVAELRAHDADWLARHEDAMLRVCRYVESTTKASKLDGLKVRRALYGVERAYADSYAASEKPWDGTFVLSDIDRLPLGHRMEAYLREIERRNAPDFFMGFLARTALHGEASARRAFRATAQVQMFRDHDPTRPSPDVLMANWDALVPPGDRDGLQP